MNEKEIYGVKDYKFDSPLITKIYLSVDNYFRGCHINFFHEFKYDCIYDIKLTNITNKEIIELTIADKSMNLYELNKKPKIARRNSFIFSRINKLTINFYSNLSNIKLCFYLNFQIPLTHRKFLKILSENPEYVKTHCQYLNNRFQFAIRRWMINQYFGKL